MPRKTAVKVTNPAASRLPQGLGAYASTPAPVEPVRPVQAPKHRQLVAGPNVVVTSPRSLHR